MAPSAMAEIVAIVRLTDDAMRPSSKVAFSNLWLQEEIEPVHRAADTIPHFARLHLDCPLWELDGGGGVLGRGDHIEAGAFGIGSHLEEFVRTSATHLAPAPVVLANLGRPKRYVVPDIPRAIERGDVHLGEECAVNGTIVELEDGHLGFHVDTYVASTQEIE
eukprot:scaffold150334_cov24-Tisochrysis_lutea.AAC.1